MPWTACGGKFDFFFRLTGKDFQKLQRPRRPVKTCFLDKAREAADRSMAIFSEYVLREALEENMPWTACNGKF